MTSPVLIHGQLRHHDQSLFNATAPQNQPTKPHPQIVALRQADPSPYGNLVGENRTDFQGRANRPRST